MMKKLRKILLIDDSTADNFIHKRVISKMNCCDEIIVTFDGQEGLDYLTTVVEGEFPKPELVFLDINMPGMTGWDFLERYNQLPDTQKAGIVVCMLTTSESEEDRTKAKQFDILSGFYHKPLTEEKMQLLLEEFDNYNNSK